MAGPRCFCAHGLRVQKGVHCSAVSDRGSECCVATHGQRSSGGRRCRMRHSAGKNRAKEKHEAWAVPFDAVQSTAAKTPDYDTRNQYQKAQNSTPEMNHTRLPHSEGDEALRTAKNCSSFYNCNSVLELRLTTPRPRPPELAVSTPLIF